jgi:hypothetical protein
MKQTEVIPAIPTEILGALQNVSNDSRKIALLVFQEIMITESELCNRAKVKMSAKKLEPAFAKLCKMQIINRHEDDSHVIWYVIHSRLLMDNFHCKGCEFKKKEVFRSPMNSAHYYTCKAPVLCAYNYYRVAHAVLKRYKAEHGLSIVPLNFRMTRKKGEDFVREYKTKRVEEWKAKDFVDFILDKYQEYYPHVPTPSRQSIQRSFTVVKKAFSEEFEDTWQFLVKHYINFNFKKASEEYKMVSMKYMTRVFNMQTYLQEHAFIHTVQECETYGFRCPYWQDGGCKLIRQQSKCSKHIRSVMRRKYN